MSILTIILNRVYYVLTKVKNKSPFFGTIILVGLLLNTLIDSIITLIYIINDTPNRDEVVYYIIWIISTLLLYLYARNRKTQIVEFKPSTKLNVLVVCVFIFAIVSFVLCANINREKLSVEKSNKIEKPKKESLEGKIRKLFD